MNKKLIIVANASVAKFFSSSLIGKNDLKIIHKIEHHESRAKGKELCSDGAGDFHPPGVTVGVHAIHSNPKEDEWDKFAKQVVKSIAGYGQQYKDIIVCASPHFEGLLSKYFDKKIEDKIRQRIVKDYTSLNNQELIDILEKSTKYIAV